MRYLWKERKLDMTVIWHYEMRSLFSFDETSVESGITTKFYHSIVILSKQCAKIVQNIDSRVFLAQSTGCTFLDQTHITNDGHYFYIMMTISIGFTPTELLLGHKRRWEKKRELSIILSSFALIIMMIALCDELNL